MSANNNHNNKVSIRLLSGGHSFSSAVVADAVAADAVLDAEVITPKTTLVPATMFDKQRVDHYLAFVGLAPAADEVAVYSPEVDDRVAVMAMSEECYAQLTLQFGGNVVFTSPIIKGHAPKQGALIDIVDDVLYVRIFNGAMLFGEAVGVANDADVLYALESINRVYNIYNMHVRARGDVNRLTKVAGCLFTNLECE